MGDTADPSRLPIITYTTVDRFGVSPFVPIDTDECAPWVHHRDVLKAWYDGANQFRIATWDDPATHKPLFRPLSKSAPHIQDPMVPALLEYSTLPFEAYTECRICTDLGPQGNLTGPGASCTMYLFVERGRNALWQANAPYWMSTVDSTFTAYIASHIHFGNRLPIGLDVSMGMLGPECVGLDVHPNRPAVCPPKVMWAKVRWAVAVRPWIKAWIEDRAERHGGPGGKVFNEELAAFTNDFRS